MLSKYLKKSLPQSEAELYAYTTEVLQGANAEDNADHRANVAEMILHLDNRQATISMNEVILMLKRRIANAVAYGHLMLAKEIAAKEALDAKAAKEAEAAKVLNIAGEGVNSQMGDSVS